MLNHKLKLSAGAVLAVFAFHAQADEQVLRLLTWADYAPQAVVDQFKKETGISVEVTLSNNEEMISKLRATGGAGYDLVNPSQDRITGPAKEFGIYQPIDLKKVKTANFIPSMLESTKKVTGLGGKVYGVPLFWGTDGLVVNSAKSKAADYSDLCKPEYAGKTAVRLKRPTLIGMAFSMGKDPFKAYANPKQYEAIMTAAGDKLISCKKNLKYFWESKDQLLNDIRNGEVVAAQMWDAGGWKLNTENATIKFIAPKSGALGWVDTFAIPSKAKNLDAAYKWINFISRPEIAAKVAKSAGSFTAIKGAENFMDEVMKKQLAESFPPAALKNIKWYPAIPAGLEEVDGKVLDKIKASN
ncbi:extracellular solute-binding protein [Leeia oryzae]|uniref:extracellular solute-binding protein n=1 Tax=Leeia oryzae TaxID=356662 RepID=UPI00035E5725|nr:extracellular solute-binding protein [Leeia oryzae]